MCWGRGEGVEASGTCRINEGLSSALPVEVGEGALSKERGRIVRE